MRGVFLLTGFIFGCGGDVTTARAGCTRDIDCKGDRVCNEGKCVVPEETGGAAGSSGTAETGGARTVQGGGGASEGGATSAESGGGSQGGATSVMDGGAHSTTGGASSSGGSIASGGSPFTGGASMSDASACSSSEKLCGGVCVRPGPSVGCNLSSCTPCPDPPPANGVLACDGGSQECSFVCLSGFTKSGSSCVSTYGAGGTGAGDAATSCGVDGSTCPDCGPNNGPGCCVNGHCGCLMLWIPGTCY